MERVRFRFTYRSARGVSGPTVVWAGGPLAARGSAD